MGSPTRAPWPSRGSAVLRHLSREAFSSVRQSLSPGEPPPTYWEEGVHYVKGLPNVTGHPQSRAWRAGIT